MLNVAIVSLLVARTALGHMEMTWPYPLQSKYNPANTYDKIDYSMVNPLGVDASGPYPCKGYINAAKSDMTPVVTWDAGASINYTIAGSATHDGGSCQIVMSYDDGKTWSVIESIIGGCLVEGLTETITIPKDAPSGMAIFGWNWVNLSGNREMYQNCAVVTITNGGSGLDSTDYPAPFVANVAEAGDCKTVEGTEVVFPNPGKNVKYGGKYANGGAVPGAGTTGNCGSVASGGSSASASSSSPVASSASTAASSTAAIVSTTTSASGTGATLFVPSSSSASTATAAAASESASTGTKTCNRKRSPAKRHERLLRRSQHDHLADMAKREPKRIAALPAKHLNHRAQAQEERDGLKRVAASPAQHLVHRSDQQQERAQPKRVAALPAQHLIHREQERAQPKRVAASPAEHLVHKREPEPKRIAALPATHLIHRKADE